MRRPTFLGGEAASGLVGSAVLVTSLGERWGDRSRIGCCCRNVSSSSAYLARGTNVTSAAAHKRDTGSGTCKGCAKHRTTLRCYQLVCVWARLSVRTVGLWRHCRLALHPHLSGTYVRLSEMRPRNRRFGTPVFTLAPLSHTPCADACSPLSMVMYPGNRSARDQRSARQSVRRKRKCLRVALTAESAGEGRSIGSRLERLASKRLRRIDLPRVARAVCPAGEDLGKMVIGRNNPFLRSRFGRQ
jgi:hypothetical protein